MYLFLAFFWLAVGIAVQAFWETLVQHAFIQVPRWLVGFACFVLFSFNFLRWRMARVRAQAVEHSDEPPPPRPRREYDPTFDFSDPTAEEEPRKDPPAKTD